MAVTRRQTLQVSDHALLRMLERAGGVDVEAVRIAIAGSVAKAAAVAEQLGQHEYTIVADGYHYIVSNGTVVTIYQDPRK